MPREFTDLSLLGLWHRPIISAIQEGEARLEDHKLKTCLSNLDFCLKTPPPQNGQGLGRGPMPVLRVSTALRRKTKLSKPVSSLEVKIHTFDPSRRKKPSDLWVQGLLVYRRSSRPGIHRETQSPNKIKQKTKHNNKTQRKKKTCLVVLRILVRPLKFCSFFVKYSNDACFAFLWDHCCD